MNVKILVLTSSNDQTNPDIPLEVLRLVHFKLCLPYFKAQVHLECMACCAYTLDLFTVTTVVIFAEVGVPVKADASFSVSRALQLQLPKQLAILEEVSEYASREYSLERALDKMQVRHAAH